jgi:hypothetical protein
MKETSMKTKIFALVSLVALLLAGCEFGLGSALKRKANAGFVPVSNITSIPSGAVKNSPLALSGKVLASNATNQNIDWIVAGATPRTTLSRVSVDSSGTFRADETGLVYMQAGIVDGTETGIFLKPFKVRVTDTFVPVTGITNVARGMLAGHPLRLRGAALPLDATSPGIDWTILYAGNTGAVLEEGQHRAFTLKAQNPGIVMLRATIVNGKKIPFYPGPYPNDPESEAYIQDFSVRVAKDFVPVTDIEGIPTGWLYGKPLLLAGIVIPGAATSRVIDWKITDAGTTEAKLEEGIEDILNTSRPGTVVLDAAIVNGLSLDIDGDFHKAFTIPMVAEKDFIKVTDIIDDDFATTIRVGDELTLKGKVQPINATNRTIVWEVKNDGGTGTEIVGTKLKATAAGTVTITARIASGLGEAGDYTEDYTITVLPAFVPVTWVNGIPTGWIAGTPLLLEPIVSPADATYNDVILTIKDAGTTGATLSSGSTPTLNTTAPGTVIITATVINGTAPGNNYVRDIPINMVNEADFVPVTDITKGFSNTLVTPVALTGTVIPNNATNKTILWSVVEDPGNSGAEVVWKVEGNQTLVARTTGKITIRATVKGGAGHGEDYYKDFPDIYIQGIDNETFKCLVTFDTGPGVPLDPWVKDMYEDISLPNANRNGYYCTGWESDGIIYAVGADYRVEGNVTFTAQWHAATGLTVTPPDIPQDETIALSVSASVAWGGSLSASAAGGPYTAYAWYVDGVAVAGTTASLSLPLGTTYGLGLHYVTVVVTKDGQRYSKSAPFTVTK